ncbi:MAG: hypothetical protein AAB919_02995 [Patescibacteria group bacterium]
MLMPALILYLYIIPVLAMVFGSWAYVYFYEENLGFLVSLGVAVLVVYPLWVWWLGAWPVHLMSLETALLVIACFVLAVIGAAVAAMTDGTW